MTQMLVFLLFSGKAPISIHNDGDRLGHAPLLEYLNQEAVVPLDLDVFLRFVCAERN